MRRPGTGSFMQNMDIDWDVVDSRLLISQDAKSRADRKTLFKSLDSNESGSLDLEELKDGVQRLLINEDGTLLLPSSLIHELPAAVEFAFNAARNLEKGAKKRRKAKKNGDKVSLSEFRPFLVAFECYLRIIELFEFMDGQSDDNQKLSLRECKRANLLLADWGITEEELEDKFAGVDAWTSHMPFKVFAQWCILESGRLANLELDESDTEEKVDSPRRRASLALLSRLASSTTLTSESLPQSIHVLEQDSRPGTQTDGSSFEALAKNPSLSSRIIMAKDTSPTSRSSAPSSPRNDKKIDSKAKVNSKQDRGKAGTRTNGSPRAALTKHAPPNSSRSSAATSSDKDEKIDAKARGNSKLDLNKPGSRRGGSSVEALTKNAPSNSSRGSAPTSSDKDDQIVAKVRGNSKQDQHTPGTGTNGSSVEALTKDSSQSCSGSSDPASGRKDEKIDRKVPKPTEKMTTDAPGSGRDGQTRDLQARLHFTQDHKELGLQNGGSSIESLEKDSSPSSSTSAAPRSNNHANEVAQEVAKERKHRAGQPENCTSAALLTSDQSTSSEFLLAEEVGPPGFSPGSRGGTLVELDLPVKQVSHSAHLRPCIPQRSLSHGSPRGSPRQDGQGPGNVMDGSSREPTKSGPSSPRKGKTAEAELGSVFAELGKSDEGHRAKVLAQQLWRDMRERVRCEQQAVNKQQAGIAQAMGQEAVDRSADDPLEHRRRALLARLVRISELETELSFLGAHGADINAQQELTPGVILPLKRKRQEVTKARYSLKLPSIMRDHETDQNSSPRTVRPVKETDQNSSPRRLLADSSLLSKHVEAAQAARAKHQANLAELADVTELYLEGDEPEDTTPVPPSPRVRTSLLPFMVDVTDVSRKVGSPRDGPDDRLQECLEGSKSGLFQFRTTKKKRSMLDAAKQQHRPSRVFSGSQQASFRRMTNQRGSMKASSVQPPVQLCSAKRSSSSEAPIRRSSAERSKRSSSSEAPNRRSSAKRSTGLDMNNPPQGHMLFGERLLRYQRSAKQAQQSPLHSVIAESAGLLSAICEELESLKANSKYCHLRQVLLSDRQSQRRAALIRGLCKQLQLLARSCRAFSKEASNLVFTISLARKMFDEGKELTKARLAASDISTMPPSKSSTVTSESPRSSKVTVCGQDRPAWLEIYWQLVVSFARLDDLACNSIKDARTGIENIRLLQERMVPLLSDAVFDGSFACELVHLSLATCFQDEFDELRLTILESFCRIFCDMARVSLLSPGAHEAQKSVGESLYNPKNHLHSGANVRWNNLPERAVTWVLASPPVPERVVSREGPSPQLTARDERMFMRQGLSGWTCVRVTKGAENFQ